MKVSASAFRIISLAALGATGWTQTGLPIQYRSIAIPGSISGAYKRSTGGNFTGHGCADVVCVIGSRPVLLTAPILHKAIHVITALTDVNDVATLPKGGTLNRDALLLATTSGLYQWTVDAATPTLLASGGWGTVTIADVNGDGIDDIIGRKRLADGVWIHLRGASPSTSSIAFSGETVYEVCGAQWHTSSVQAEMCITTSQRFQVRQRQTDGSWTVLREDTTTNTGPGLLARVDMNGVDMVAWLSKHSGVTELRTLSATLNYTTVLTGDPVAMSAARVTDDSYDDLVIALANTSKLHVLVNQWATTPSNPPFVGSYTLSVSVSPLLDATANTASPWCGDINHDGLADFVLPIQGYARIDVMKQPSAGASRLTAPPSLANEIAQTGGATSWTVDVAPATSVPAGATHIEVLVFELDPLADWQMLPAGERFLYPASSSTVEIKDSLPITSVRPHYGFLRYVQRSGSSTTHYWEPRTLYVCSPSDYSGLSTSLAGLEWTVSGPTSPIQLKHNGVPTNGGAIDPPPPPPPPTPPAPPGGG